MYIAIFNVQIGMPGTETDNVVEGHKTFGSQRELKEWLSGRSSGAQVYKLTPVKTRAVTQTRTEVLGFEIAD